MKTRIGFIYYTFFPVVGGASVHGYNLAKELNRLGYELWKMNGDPDPWTVKKPKGLRGLIAILRHCDVIYVRMDYFLNFRNLTTLLASLFGKKVIVELNSPSDELVLFGRGMRYIRFIDSVVRFILRRVNAVIVVSPEIETYCKEALGLENVTVIENGGERFSSASAHSARAADSATPANSIKTIDSSTSTERVTTTADHSLNSLREQYRTVIIWSGSVNDMQHLDWIQKIARQINPDQALVLSLFDTSDRNLDIPDAENIYLIRNPDRQLIRQITRQADIGLAFYREYPWSRWGFYNSSLKIQEYLVNGLISISNIEGSADQRRQPGFRQAHDISGVMDIISNHTRAENPDYSTCRSWADVALDTQSVISKVINR